MPPKVLHVCLTATCQIWEVFSSLALCSVLLTEHETCIRMSTMSDFVSRGHCMPLRPSISIFWVKWILAKAVANDNKYSGWCSTGIGFRASTGILGSGVLFGRTPQLVWSTITGHGYVQIKQYHGVITKTRECRPWKVRRGICTSIEFNTGILNSTIMRKPSCFGEARSTVFERCVL